MNIQPIAFPVYKLPVLSGNSGVSLLEYPSDPLVPPLWAHTDCPLLLWIFATKASTQVFWPVA